MFGEISVVTKKRIYQFCLALPLVVPVIFLPFFWYLQSLGEYFAGFVMVILYSGYVGGVPYLILLVPLVFWIRKKSARETRRALLWSPVLMLIPLAICYGIYQFGFSPGLTFVDTLKMYTVFLLFFGICTLVFGYFYVGIALALASLLGSETDEP